MVKVDGRYAADYEREKQEWNRYYILGLQERVLLTSWLAVTVTYGVWTPVTP